MAATHGTGTVVIRRSHHIACLAVYLLRATERGLVAIVQSSDPKVFAVVPHGGLTPIITPNPIAAGLPTSGDPILIDISSSITSMGFANQQMKAGKSSLAHGSSTTRATPRTIRRAVRGAEGRAIAAGRPRRRLQGIRLGAPHRGADRRAFRPRPRGSAGGLGRHGVRAGARSGGIRRLEAFKRQMDQMVDAAHASTPRAGVTRVRLPGEAGMTRLREHRTHGVALYPTIMPALAPWAEKLGVAMPR
jgi:L-lactate dehydrogenase